MTDVRENPYTTLGVDPQASDEVIRSAYRRLARKYHPDKGGSEADFRKIQEAYQILNDPEKRSLFDRFGWEALEKNPDGAGAMPDVFAHFFGGRFGGSDRRGFHFFQGSMPQPSRGAASDPKRRKRMPDREISITVTAKDAYQGRTLEHTLTRKRYRKTEMPSDPSPCRACQGEGRIPMRHPNLPPFLMIPTGYTVCSQCAGLGMTVCEKDMETVRETVRIDIPRFCPDGWTCTFSNLSDEIPGIETGRVVFIVHHEKSASASPSTPRIDPPHVISTIPLTLSEAIWGFSRSVEFLDGRTYRIGTPAGRSLFSETEPRNTVYDTIRVVAGEGFYTDASMIRRGDWILHFVIQFPTGDTTHFGPTPLPPVGGIEDSNPRIEVSTLPTLQVHQRDGQESSSHGQRPGGVHAQECRPS